MAHRGVMDTTRMTGPRPTGTPDLPPGPLSRAELRRSVPDRAVHEHYTRLWHDCYRLRGQADDLALRTAALARQCPQGVVCGRSAALLWGDDSAPPGTEPEIWLARPRNTRPGRRYRSGDLPPSAITRLDGLAVTTLLRTCLDLSRWGGGDEADTPGSGGGMGALTVSVDRLAAANPGLVQSLGADPDDPAAGGAGGCGARAVRRRLAAAVAASDPRSPSAAASWARVWVTRRIGGGFVHRSAVVLDGGTVWPALADPVARIAVEFRAPGDSPAPDRHGRLPQWLRDREMLRAAGWTTVVVTDPDTAGGGRSFPADRAPDGDRAAAVVRALRQLWPGTAVLPPHDGRRSVLDPVGIWGGYRAAGSCSGADGSRW